MRVAGEMEHQLRYGEIYRGRLRGTHGAWEENLLEPRKIVAGGSFSQDYPSPQALTWFEYFVRGHTSPFFDVLRK